MAIGTPVETKKITAQDYLEHYPITSEPMELINGEIVIMPSPVKSHSSIVSNMMWILLAHSKPQGLGEVLTEPTDVHLDTYNVVQPDVFFIHKDNTQCRVGADGYLHGSPDLCVEVLSPSTAKRDRTDKFDLYERFGVREYWLVDPDLQLVEVYQREGDYLRRIGAYDETKTFNALVLAGLTVKVADIFPVNPST